MSEIVQVNHLSKQFTEVKAVQDLSFSVPAGEIYGFLGQNGAGKSTTIRMLLTLISPDAGSIHILGKDIRQHRQAVLRNVGAIIEKPDLYKYLTALENLRIMAKLSGIAADKPLLMGQLEKVGLADRANSKVKTFSQGMKQRLGIACALVHDPQLIVLDEPTNGLDPQGIADVRNLILHLSREERKTVFVSSHLLSEIELIADSMLIVDKGRKVAEGRVSELLNPAHTLVEIIATNNEAAKSRLAGSAWQEHLQPGNGLVVKMHKQDIPRLARFLVEQGIELVSLRPRHSLEDYFLSLTTANQHVAAYRN
ncbi:MAG TPA: ABC transporter ATP-binding protein [Flavisolibacter sp.]|nr:ABC transporter ATP-binding protein [Flavisolibacter sp.]